MLSRHLLHFWEAHLQKRIFTLPALEALTFVGWVRLREKIGRRLSLSLSLSPPLKGALCVNCWHTYIIICKSMWVCCCTSDFFLQKIDPISTTTDVNRVVSAFILLTNDKNSGYHISKQVNEVSLHHDHHKLGGCLTSSLKFTVF